MLVHRSDFVGSKLVLLVLHQSREINDNDNNSKQGQTPIFFSLGQIVLSQWMSFMFVSNMSVLNSWKLYLQCKKSYCA